MTRRTRSIQISDVIRAAIKLPSGLDVTDQANTARNQANSAFDHANTAYSHAGNAFNHANNAHNQANAAYSAANTKLNSSGGTISGNLTVTGNLFVEGDSTSFNVASLLIEDSEIYLNNNQTTPSLNASIFAERGSSTDTFLRWNESTDRWGWSDDGTTLYSFDDLRSGLATTNTTFGTINTNIGTAYSQANAAYGQANSAYGAANNRVLKAGDTMTGQLNISSGGLLVTGNLGIGTTNPEGPLHVKSTSAYPAYIFEAANTAIYAGPYLNLRNPSLSSNFGETSIQHTLLDPNDLTNVVFQIQQRTTNSSFVRQILQYDYKNQHWQFFTNGSEKMRITSGGNVGIGATSPSAKLHIQNTNIGTAPVAAFYQYSGTAASPTEVADWPYPVLSLRSYGNFYRQTMLSFGLPNDADYKTDESVWCFRLNGVTASGWDNNSNTTPSIASSSDLGLELLGPGNLRLGTVGAKSILFRTNNTDKVFINSDGNVGIGTSSPSQKLDVTGSIRASSQLISTVATGTAPLAVSSTTAVTNLNADLLDGYQASSFVQRTNASDQATLWNPYGDYYTSVWGVGNDYNNFVNAGSYHVDPNASNRPEAIYGYLRIWRHIGSNYLLQEFTSSSSSATTWRRLGQDNGSGGRIWTGWAKYWSDGNDGSGSGLDADLLDGIQGSSFLRSDASATNSVDLRAPIFYDSNDTSYYLNPASTSKTYDMWAVNRLYTGSNQNFININYDQIWRPDNGTLHLQHSGSGAINMCNGGGTVTSVGNFYAPIMYDNNNAAYYVDPAVNAGSSRLFSLTPNVLYFFGVGGDSGIGNQAYAIYQEAGSWTHPYPDLAIAYHTGIKIGAYFGYNGTRFYNNNDMGTQIASVGDGDNNFRSYYNVIAYASDGRLKENIQPIENAIEKVKKITGMTFDWKPMVKDLGFEPNSIHETGVIAQDVEAVLPEAVEIAPFDYDWKQPNKSKSGEKYLTVKYEKLVPLLIQAIKEQQEQIEELKNLIKEKL